MIKNTKSKSSTGELPLLGWFLISNCSLYFPRTRWKEKVRTNRPQLSLEDSRNIHSIIYSVDIDSPQHKSQVFFAYWFVWKKFFTAAFYIKMLHGENKEDTKTQSAVAVIKFLTRFDLLDNRFVVVVPHLSDIQQCVRVAIMWGPVVHENPRAAATTVHHNAIIKGMVEDISGLHGLCDGEVSGRGQMKNIMRLINMYTPAQLSVLTFCTSACRHFTFYS